MEGSDYLILVLIVQVYPGGKSENKQSSVPWGLGLARACRRCCVRAMPWFPSAGAFAAGGNTSGARTAERQRTPRHAKTIEK